MSDAMIQMAPGSRLDDERILRLRQQWGELKGGPDYDSWIEGKLLQAEGDLSAARDRIRGDDQQFCEIAAYFAKDARHGPQANRTIAGMVVEEYEQLRNLLGESQTMCDSLLTERDKCRGLREQFWTIEEWIPPENAIGGTGFWTELDDGHTHERLQAFRWYRKLKSDGRCVRMCEYTKRIEYDSSEQEGADE